MLTIALLVDALVLHLEEEVARAEDVAIGRRRLERLARLIGPKPGRHLALQAAAQADQPLRVRGEQLLVDARLVVEPVRVARRDELDEVVKALVRLREQHEMVGRLARRARSIGAAAGRDVDLAAEDRLDAALPRLVVERHGREHVAVLGDRHGRHLQLGGPIEQLADPARAVEQRELRVQVQVDELGTCPPTSHSIVAGGFELMS